MRKEKTQAIRMRKQGKSYNEINKKIGVPKSTLSLWLHTVTLPGIARKRLLNRGRKKSVAALVQRNKEQTTLAAQRARGIQECASQDIKKIERQTLFFIGLALYWGEGYKKGAEGSKWKCVDFVNADPYMIQVMMRFFREICHVSENKFRIQLHIHEDVDGAKAIRFWTKTIRVPSTQFMKMAPIKNKNRKQKNGRHLQYGTIHIRIYDVRLFHNIIGWIHGLKKQSGCSSVG